MATGDTGDFEQTLLSFGALDDYGVARDVARIWLRDVSQLLRLWTD